MELIEVKHIVQPGLVQRVSLAEPEETIASFLERSEWKFKCPTICVSNGTPILRKDWATTTISSSRSIDFVSRPHGGGGGGGKARQVMGLLAIVAIMAIAPWAAGPSALALEGFAYYATVAAISVAGGLLVSTFLSAKAATNSDAPIAQLYSLTATGNIASPLEPIPVQYGRLKVEPKYAGSPWHEYIGDDLFLNVPLCLGVGLFDHEQILIDDTVMWDHITGLQSGFADITWQWVEPGDHLTLFPSNVVESGEVSNQSVTDTPSPFYVVNAPGTLATKLTYDIVFPGGLYTVSPEGQYGNASVQLFGFIQKINDAGSPIGGPIASVDVLITMCNRQPKRISLECPGLAPGRYSARLYRQNPESTSTTVQDAIIWAGLRGFLQGGDTFPEVSVLALRMKATAQLSQSSAKRIAVIQTRKIPVWNGSGFTTQASQNAFYAFLDAATNSVYGANRAINKIDLNTIVAQAIAADAREDTFNYVFSNPQVTFQSAFDLILSSARSKVSWVGDILSVVRDEWKPIPQMLLTDQQIVRGSLSVDYIFNEEDSSDCVVGQFLNEDTWGPAQLQYPPNAGGFVGLKPATIRIEGITKPSHLYEEIGFMYRQSQLRRIRLRLDTEHDGRLLRFGSPVKVQSFLPNKWGVSGEVLTYNVGTHILTVSQEMPIEVGQHYIELRDKGGHYFGPVKCSLVSGHPNQVLVDATDLAAVEASLSTTLLAALDRMNGAEPPSFAYGLAGNLSRSCIVITGKPSDDRVTLELTIDSAAVHVTNEGDTPPQPTSPVLSDPRVPVVIGLIAIFKQSLGALTLDATWWPSPGTLYYRAQVSYDGGTSWIPVSDSIQQPALSVPAERANLTLRVSAVGRLQGPWTSVEVEAPTVSNPFITGTENLEAGLADYVTNQLNNAMGEINRIRQIIASAAADLDAGNYVEQAEIKRSIGVHVDAATASFTESILAAVGPGSALVRKQTELTATVGSNTSRITTTESAIATTNGALTEFETAITATTGDHTARITSTETAVSTINGKMAAAWALKLDVNSYVTSMEFLNDGTTGSLIFNTDNFVIAKPGILSPTAVFSLQTVGGVTNMALQGNFFADGVIQAQMIAALAVTTAALNAGAVTTIKLDAQAVTAAKIKVGDITSASGTIGALSLDSLSLADNAVTVPTVATLTSFLGTGTGAAIFNFNLSINTTGLSGKIIPIFVLCKGSLNFTAVNQAWQATLFINGSQVDEHTGNNGTFLFVSGARNITGNGGVMSINVTANWNCSNQGTITTAVIFAQAAKR